MSEPFGAFVKLRIPRDRLVAWLDSPPRPASGWSDWRSIGGSWYAGGGPKPLADYSAAEYAESIAECDSLVKRYSTVRAALRDTLDAAAAPQLKHASYDATAGDFIVGTPTYDENLTSLIAFFAIARSASAYLAPDGHGVATVHNYLWGSEDEQTTVAAIRLGPGDRSEFMESSEAPSASAAFGAIVDEMLNSSESTSPPDELDALK